MQQIDFLINGRRSVIRDLSHPKYLTAPKGSSAPFGGSNLDLRRETGAKVFAENGGTLRIRVRGKKDLSMNLCASTTGRTRWYACDLSRGEVDLVRGFSDPKDGPEFCGRLEISENATVTLYCFYRKNVNCQWRSSSCEIGEELVEILAPA